MQFLVADSSRRGAKVESGVSKAAVVARMILRETHGCYWNAREERRKRSPVSASSWELPLPFRKSSVSSF